MNYFEQCPTEIKLRIISNLTTSEIETMSWTSQHFRTLIREPNNQVVLYRPVQDRSRAYLHHRIDNVLSFDTDKSFLTDFARFIAHSGIEHNSTMRALAAQDFLVMWNERLASNQVEYMTLIGLFPLQDDFRFVATLMLEEHLRSHTEGAVFTPVSGNRVVGSD